MPITFHQADVVFKFKDTALLKTFLQKQFQSFTSKRLTLSVVFCSDNFLLNINKTYLNHDYYTDIITFPLEETNRKTEAEIYISLDRTWENATKLKVSFEEELKRVLFHGVLHLCGFKDKSKADKEKMTKAENGWLELFSKIEKQCKK